MIAPEVWVPSVALVLGAFLGLLGVLYTGRRKSSENIEEIQQTVNTLVEERERLKQEKAEDKAQFNAQIAELRGEVKVLKEMHERDQKEIHDLHAIIGKNFVEVINDLQLRSKEREV
jgi:hypothetical protein